MIDNHQRQLSKLEAQLPLNIWIYKHAHKDAHQLPSPLHEHEDMQFPEGPEQGPGDLPKHVVWSDANGRNVGKEQRKELRETGRGLSVLGEYSMEPSKSCHVDKGVSAVQTGV